MEDFRVIRITGDSRAHVDSQRQDMIGLILFDLYVQEIKMIGEMDQENGVWCQRVYVEGTPMPLAR